MQLPQVSICFCWCLEKNNIFPDVDQKHGDVIIMAKGKKHQKKTQANLRFWNLGMLADFLTSAQPGELTPNNEKIGTRNETSKFPPKRRCPTPWSRTVPRPSPSGCLG